MTVIRAFKAASETPASPVSDTGHQGEIAQSSREQPLTERPDERKPNNNGQKESHPSAVGHSHEVGDAYHAQHSGPTAMVGEAVHSAKAGLHTLTESTALRGHAHTAVSDVLNPHTKSMDSIVRSVLKEAARPTQAFESSTTLKAVFRPLIAYNTLAQHLEKTRGRLYKATTLLHNLRDGQIASPKVVAAAESQVAALTTTLQQQTSKLKGLRAGVLAAREIVRQVMERTPHPGAESRILHRAAGSLSEVTHGPRVLKLAETALHNPATEALDNFLSSPKLRVAGNALIVGAILLDMHGSHRHHETKYGGLMREQVAGVTSTVFYTAPAWAAIIAGQTGANAAAVAGTLTGVGLLVTGTLAAEALYWDAPHITGMLSGAAQVMGVAADYVEGGADRADHSAAKLKQEIDAGVHGGAVKIAMLLTSAVSESGVMGYGERVVDYYSSVSPEKFAEDFGDMWTWAF